MKNAGLFVILFFRRKIFEKSTCFLLAGLSNRKQTQIPLLKQWKKVVGYFIIQVTIFGTQKQLF